MGLVRLACWLRPKEPWVNMDSCWLFKLKSFVLVKMPRRAASFNAWGTSTVYCCFKRIWRTFDWIAIFFSKKSNLLYSWLYFSGSIWSQYPMGNMTLEYWLSGWLYETAMLFPDWLAAPPLMKFKPEFALKLGFLPLINYGSAPAFEPLGSDAFDPSC